MYATISRHSHARRNTNETEFYRGINPLKKLVSDDIDQSCLVNHPSVAIKLQKSYVYSVGKCARRQP